MQDILSVLDIVFKITLEILDEFKI